MAFHAIRERNPLLIIEFVSESHRHGIHISLNYQQKSSLITLSYTST